MEKIWLLEMSFGHSNEWTAVSAYREYNRALYCAREKNREQRGSDHKVKYKIDDVLLD